MDPSQNLSLGQYVNLKSATAQLNRLSSNTGTSALVLQQYINNQQQQQQSQSKYDVRGARNVYIFDEKCVNIC
jgi:hypothetical protein